MSANGNAQWVLLYRTVAIGSMGVMIYFAQEIHSEVKKQRDLITTIMVDGAGTKESLKNLDERVKKLEDAQEREEGKRR